jgi:hypothetical protein
MKHELEKLLDRDRKFVFVGHGTGGDISVLKLVGVDLETSIVGYFDTNTVAWEIHSKPIRFCATKAGSLETLAKILGMSYRKEDFHNAGNDASFALRALLLMAVEDYRNEIGQLDEASRGLLLRISDIGSYPQQLPPITKGRQNSRRKINSTE